MALNTQLSDTSANAAANAIATLLNSGYIKIYAGAQPANANAGDGGAALLATLQFGATAFGNAVAGVATANSIAAVNASGTNTATWFRCLKSDNSTVVLDGSVGVSGSNLNLNSTALQTGAQVQITSFTLTESEAGS